MNRDGFFGEPATGIHFLTSPYMVIKEFNVDYAYLILFFKIINSLIPIKLPEHFTAIKPKDVRFTRKTATIIEDKNMTSIK